MYTHILCVYSWVLCVRFACTLIQVCAHVYSFLRICNPSNRRSSHARTLCDRFIHQEKLWFSVLMFTWYSWKCMSSANFLVRACVNTNICTRILSEMRVCVQQHMNTWFGSYPARVLYIYIYIYIYIYTRVYIYIYTHTHKHYTAHFNIQNQHGITLKNGTRIWTGRKRLTWHEYALYTSAFMTCCSITCNVRAHSKIKRETGTCLCMHVLRYAHSVPIQRANWGFCRCMCVERTKLW